MLIRLARQYVRGRVLMAVSVIVLLQCAQVLCSLLLPSLNADIIDRGVSGGDLPLIWRLGGQMLAFSVVQALASGFAIYLAARVSMGFGHWLRGRVFRHVQRFSSSDLREFGAPSLITRCTNDAQQIQMVMFLVLEILVIAPLMGVGGVVMAVIEDAPLAALLLVVVPVLAVSVGIIMRKLSPRFRAQQGAIDRITDVLRAQLSGVRVIRAFRRQGAERARYGVANEHLRALSLSIGALFALMIPLVTLIMSLSQVAVVWFGGARIVAGGMEVGSLTAYLTYLALILMSVMMASFVFTMLPRAQVCADRIGEVLDHTPSVSSPPAAGAAPQGRVTFSLEGACVRYGDAEKPVLAPVDLTFAPGTTTALIGSTGSGKTTLISLLPRLRDPSSGRVCVNGVDVREVDLDWLRGRVAYVPQTAYLFSGTVATSVAAVGEGGEVDSDRLARALTAAQADEFVAALPEGVASRVEAGGTNFSGGQRQRLAIARALYRRADLYVFDDSFSALDYVTDARLRGALPAFVEGAAVVIVAQRVSTIRHADLIVVLDHGEVVGRGRHDDLMVTCPTYREIVESQMSEEEAA